MNRAITMVLTLILFVLGIIIVFARPWNATAISIGMFLVAVSVLNIAIQIYFPPPRGPVQLRVIERPVTTQRITRAKNVRKRAKRRKTARKSAKRRSTRRRRRRR